MKRTATLQVLDEYAKKLSKKQASMLYETKMNKKYSKMLYESEDDMLSLYLDAYTAENFGLTLEEIKETVLEETNDIIISELETGILFKTMNDNEYKDLLIILEDYGISKEVILNLKDPNFK